MSEDKGFIVLSQFCVKVQGAKLGYMIQGNWAMGKKPLARQPISILAQQNECFVRIIGNNGSKPLLNWLLSECCKTRLVGYMLC